MSPCDVVLRRAAQPAFRRMLAHLALPALTLGRNFSAELAFNGLFLAMNGYPLKDLDAIKTMPALASENFDEIGLSAWIATHCVPRQPTKGVFRNRRGRPASERPAQDHPPASAIVRPC